MRASKVTTLLRSASGSSQPWHGQLEDGSDWLVKFAGAGPGRDALLAECIANRLGRLWGFPIPEARPVLLDASVDRVGTDEFWDVLDASVGWNLGIQTIAGAVDVIPSEGLPKATLEAMISFDTLVVNWDRAVISRNLMRDEAAKLWWIDHGSCRFLHGLARREPQVLPSNHFLFEVRESIARRPMPMPSRADLASCVEDLPDEWLTTSSYDRESLPGALEVYLASQGCQ